VYHKSIIAKVWGSQIFMTYLVYNCENLEATKMSFIS
jgi:hypothetical protein